MKLEYCTYLTVYFGYKLPRRYIGSSTVDRVNNGYHGSISSKKYKLIYKAELIENPNLFKTRILSRHANRKDAVDFERTLHIKYDVVKSAIYMNETIAGIKFFVNNPFVKGHILNIGKSNPMFGKKHNDDSKKKTSDFMTQWHKEVGLTPESRERIRLANTGLTRSKEARERMSKSAITKKRYTCPICNKGNLDGGNFSQHMKHKHTWSIAEISNYKTSLFTHEPK